MTRYTEHRRNSWLLTALAMLSALLADIAGAADVFNGRAVYDTHCQSCHGDDGTSMMPGTPDFTSGEMMVRPDTELLKRIREGSDFMPAYRGMLEDNEIMDVIAYIRSLQK